jgi:hypothetical protein
MLTLESGKSEGRGGEKGRRGEGARGREGEKAEAQRSRGPSPSFPLRSVPLPFARSSCRFGAWPAHPQNWQVKNSPSLSS